MHDLLCLQKKQSKIVFKISALFVRAAKHDILRVAEHRFKRKIEMADDSARAVTVEAARLNIGIIKRRKDAVEVPEVDRICIGLQKDEGVRKPNELKSLNECSCTVEKQQQKQYIDRHPPLFRIKMEQ